MAFCDARSSLLLEQTLYFRSGKQNKFKIFGSTPLFMMQTLEIGSIAASSSSFAMARNICLALTFPALKSLAAFPDNSNISAQIYSSTDDLPMRQIHFKNVSA